MKRVRVVTLFFFIVLLQVILFFGLLLVNNRHQNSSITNSSKNAEAEAAAAVHHFISDNELLDAHHQYGVLAINYHKTGHVLNRALTRLAVDLEYNARGYVNTTDIKRIKKSRGYDERAGRQVTFDRVLEAFPIRRYVQIKKSCVDFSFRS